MLHSAPVAHGIQVPAALHTWPIPQLAPGLLAVLFMAVKQQFGLSARATPIGTIPGVFEEVARGGADFGVVPVENTTEGGIIHTFDTFLDSDLKISAEIALEIHMAGR